MIALTIARRDLAAYLHGYSAYIIIAAILGLQGLFFNAWVLGASSARYSHEVLEQFFYLDGGFAMAAAILLTMRSIAEERSNGTDVLLGTSTASDAQIVFGKWLAAMAMVTLLTVLTVYMPGLIMVNGKVAVGHVVVGYFGVLCLGGATAAIGVFGSSMFRSQLAAGIFTTVFTITLVVMWILSEITDPPFADLASYMAIWNMHFTPFQEGRLTLSSVAYYGTVTTAFLFLATRILEARRWE
ncbi:MAG: ABC-2 type transport system permease protein [Myxococcota bacterium]|jgi:ABC-2 type transport system permease protein